MDSLNEEVGNFTNLFTKHYYNQALFIIIGLILMALVVYAFFQRGGAYMQKIFLQQGGDIIFKKLFDLSNEAIIVATQGGELLYQNDIAHNLFYGETHKYILDDTLNLANVEDDIYFFSTGDDIDNFVKYRKEYVVYRNNDCNIYIIQDITADYIQTHSLEKLAYNDELTGLPNRRALNEAYLNMCQQITSNDSLVLGMLDIDYFKKVNDTYGHTTGDKVLILLASVFKQRLRHHDGFYRFGGEEFVVMLRDIDLVHAKELLMDMNKVFFVKTLKMNLGSRSHTVVVLYQLIIAIVMIH